MKSLLLVVFALVAANMTAANVDAGAAQAKAIRFLNSQPATRFMASTANLHLTHAEKSSVGADMNDYFVFNFDNGGYVIVSGDDRAEEILGYGSGYFEMKNLPSNVAWWMKHYKEQMEYLLANPKLEVETTSKFMSTMLTATTVPMLMTSTWDQEAPYYNQCPKYNGSYCMTGCVATAMAQVMYYWKYPATLPALDAYTTAETPRFNVPALPGITLDWDNMLDDYSSVSYNTTQANAVAWLMRYCGQAVEMMYSPDGSGAYTEDECAAMIKFGYSSDATVKYRDDYSATDWNAMMQAELEARRPILYGGNDYSAGGHAFVVDGYNASTSKYHVNFGWSGYDDNYYALDAFKGSGYTFKYYQDMIIGVYPENQSTLETYAPVMADASNVGTTSFKATWTDETPSENVTDYTLYVDAYDPNQQTLLTETFAGATTSGTTNISGSLDNYCDNAGWTGTYVYQADGGLRVGHSSYSGSLTTPALDLSTSGGTITVNFNAKYWSSSDNSTVIVSCGSASQTVQLTADATDYIVVLQGVTAASGQKVTFANTGGKKRFYIYNVDIVTGAGSASLRASETGDANSRIITGITSKNYTVSGLNEGGSYRFYVVANYTDGSIKESNVKTVTLEGTATPVPEIIVDPETLTMSANVGETATATFEVLAADLTGNVSLTLNDANGVYSINPTAISMADAQEGATVTVTYAPTVAGTHNATITVASEGAEAATVALNGTSTMQTTAPVMAEATNVGTTSFTATWTDATAAAYVTDYTLYVNKVGGAVGNLLMSETFAGVSVTKDGTTDRGSSMDNYCDNAGWTGYAAYEAVSGGFKLGSGSKAGYITTPALAENSGTLVVVFNANSYSNDASSVIVSCGDVSETVALGTEAADYTVTLAGVPSAAGQKVTLSCTTSGKRLYIHSVNIYDGAAAASKASETGDENSRVITGITDKAYTVTGLTAGATYSFYVVANYTDGSNANSNTERVTLLDEPVAPTPELIADPETLTLNANVGETVTGTFDILGADLTGEVTITLTDETGMFTVTPATIAIADAEEGATITVTYAPTAAGDHNATITVSSEGAEDVTVPLAGSAEMPLGALVMLPADAEYITTSSFRADWTDETNAAYVQDYTLYVNIKGEPVTPGGLLLDETFYSEEVPSTDNNIDLGANGTLDDCCDNAGWTGYAVYLAGGGGMKLGANTKIGYLTTPALDLSASGGTVTVKFNARSYGNDGSSVIVSCGEVADTIELTAEAADYTVVLNGVPAEADQNVTLSGVANKKRFYLYSVQVYSGEAVARAVSETGDENSRVITGITDKYYVVEGLTAGATYDYYVVANYIDGTDATSNVETVTLLDNQGHGYALGDVDHDGEIAIADVTILINYLLTGEGNVCEICANVNQDNEISIADVTALINKLLTGE